MKRAIIILIFFLTLRAGYLSAGGPWANGKGQGYAQFGVSLNRYDRLRGTTTRLDRTITDNTLQFYGEFGLTERLSIMTSIPYKLLSTGKTPLNPNKPQAILPSGTLSGFGNISLAAKYTLFQKNIHVAVQLLTETPNYKINNLVGLRTGYNSFVVCPSVLAGVGTGKLYGFVNLGYAIRSGGYSEEVRYDIEAGYTPLKRFGFALVFNNKSSLKNGSINEGNIVKTGLYVNNQGYNAWGLKLAYTLTENIGINTSVYGAFYGRNVAATPLFNGSIYYKW